MNKEVRVLHYIKHLENGGGETLIYNIYKNVDRRNVQFDFAVNTQKKELLNEEVQALGAQIYSLIKKEPSITLFKMITCAIGLKRLLKTVHYDIIHIHCSNSQGLLFAYVAKKMGVKNRIVHIHNSGVDGKFKIVKKAVHLMLKKLFIGSATEYYACSQMAAEWLFTKDIIENGQYSIIKNGIDCNTFKFDIKKRMEQRAKLHIQDEVVICSVGRLEVEKNQLFLLQIFKCLIDSGLKYKLLLIGRGTLLPVIKEKIKNYGLEQNVILIDRTNCVEKYLFASDIFVLPSLHEGLGIVAIESQAAGLSTFVSDGVPQEVCLTDLISQIDLKEPADIWAKVIANAKLCNNREIYSSVIKESGYEIKKVAKELEKRYLDLV